MLGASVAILVRHWLDQRWRASLQPARCRVVWARREEGMKVRQVSPIGEYPDHVASYTEKTYLMLEVEGVGPKRMVSHVLDGRRPPPGPVIDCWVTGATAREVVVYPDAEAADRLKDNLMFAFAALIWSAFWFSVRRDRPGQEPASK